MNVEVGGDADEDCVDCTDLHEDKLPECNSSDQLNNVSASDEAASMPFEQPCIKGVSSYGKSNFVLPVTFFDIQSNLTLLKECCPLTIKVVDCDKHPSFYKKYLNPSVSAPSADSASDNCQVVKEKEYIIDLTETMDDQLQNLHNRENKSKLNEKNDFKRNKKPHRNHFIKRTLINRQQHDKIKNIALSKLNVTQIDFKRNLGLIGLKICHRLNITETIPGRVNATNQSSKEKCQISFDATEEKTNKKEAIGVNANPSVAASSVELIVDNMEAQKMALKVQSKEFTNEQTVKVSTDECKTKNNLDKYMFVVDKALNNVGTTIIPVDTNVHTSVKASEQLLSQTKLNGPTKQSGSDIQIIKSKLSKSTLSKISPKQQTKKKRITKNMSKNINKQSFKTQIRTKERKHDNTNTPTEILKKQNCKGPIKKIIDVEGYNPVLKPAHNTPQKVKDDQFIELGDGITTFQNEAHTQLNDTFPKDSARSKSPIFLCNVNKSNKNNVNNCKSASSSGQLELNKDCNLVKQNSVAHQSTINYKRSHTKNNFSSNDDTLVPDAQCDKSSKQNVDVGTDKLTDNNEKKNDTITDTNLLKPVYKHKYTPTQYVLSARNNTNNSIQDNIIKNGLPMSQNLLQNAETAVNKIQPLMSCQVYPSHQQKDIQQRQNKPGQYFRPQIAPANYAVNNHQHNYKIKHYLPVQVHTSDRRYYRNNILPRLDRHSKLTQPSYNDNNMNRIMTYPYVAQKNLQQNMYMLQNARPSNDHNTYWPYVYPPQMPPLPRNAPLPPPPPPPPPPANCQSLLHNTRQNPVISSEGSMQNVVRKVNIIAIKKRGNPSDSDKNVNCSNKLQNSVDGDANVDNTNQHFLPNTKINTDIVASDVKTVVSSKTEMFQELQKEMVKINTELSSNNKINELKNQALLYSHVPSNAEKNPQVSNNMQGVTQQDTSTRIAPSTTVTCDSKLVHSQPKEEQKCAIKRDDARDWHVKLQNGNKPTDNNLNHVKTSDDTAKHYKKSLSSNTEHNTPKPGPLCMKNKTGPFAKLQTPPRSSKNQNDKSHSSKGYSPPILPIPTFQKSLEMLTQVNKNNGNKQVTTNKKYTDSPKTSHYENNKVLPGGGPKRKRLQYFCVNKEENSLKKISLQDYQKRVAKGDDKCIVLKKDSSCKRLKRNQSSEQDLGYDSDVTVKL